METLLSGPAGRVTGKQRVRDRAALMQDAVGCLYESAGTPEQWGDALDRVYRLFDSMAAHFFLWNEATDQPVASQGSTTYKGQQDALKYYLRIDPRRRLLAGKPVGATLLCHEHFDDDFVRHDEFFQDYSLRLDRRYLMAVRLHQAGPTASILAILRSPRQGPFGPDQRALLQHLAPHLHRVARMHYQWRQQQIERDLLDNVPGAMLAADAEARVVRMNQAAETLLAEADGLRLVAGRLAAWQTGQTHDLHRLIRQAARGTAADGGLIIGGASGERYGLVITRLTGRSSMAAAPDGPLAMVVATRLTQEALSRQLLMAMFGLTPAEARLAAEIAAGQRLDALAEAHHVTLPTLRTQLRAIYGKTGTSRQSELVRLLAALPPVRRST